MSKVTQLVTVGIPSRSIQLSIYQTLCQMITIKRQGLALTELTCGEEASVQT